jgi:phosphatidylglycerophosphate synthase
MPNPPDGSPKPLKRIQRNFLASLEQRLLTWFCSRMPQWVTPDILTTTAVVGAVGVFIGYAASSVNSCWLWLAIGGYVVQWFGDSMDGNLARFRRIERPSFGYFIDHSCDGIATLLILAGLGLSPFVRLDVSLIALAGYLLLSIHAFLSARALGELRLSYMAAGPTELRLALIALTFAMLILGSGPRLVGRFSTYDLIVGMGAMALITLFIVQTILTGRRIAASEHESER